MKVPQSLSFLSPYVEGDNPIRLTQGLVVGVVVTMILGFHYGGWNLGSTTEKMANEARQQERVATLAPICVANFQKAASTDKGLIVALQKADSWNREDNLMKAGWVTFPGGKEPDRDVANACVEKLMELHPAPSTP
ncbi:MAG: hypothetical protein NUV60_03585 [Patescibacteria group bacterium]|nr:hypothetical protein [Patescibacteria group bacterium]